METGWLLPNLADPTTSEFWLGCARGELLVQACAACGAWRMPPRPMCPHCRSTEVTWARDVGPRPHLVVHRPAPAAAARVRRGRAVQHDRRRARRGPVDPLRRQSGRERRRPDQRDRPRDDHDRRTRAGRVPPDRRRDAPPLDARLTGAFAPFYVAFTAGRQPDGAPAPSVPVDKGREGRASSVAVSRVGGSRPSSPHGSVSPSPLGPGCASAPCRRARPRAAAA